MDILGYQSEAELEKQLIEDLSSRGYEKIKIEDMDELEENFRVQLNKFNSNKLNDTPLSDKEFQRVLLTVNDKSVYHSAKILRDDVLLDRDDGTKVYLDLFDDKEYSRNIYQITNQVTLSSKYTNRYDVTILANGLPVIQIELKRRGMDIKQAFNQIERYRKHSFHGLFRYVQMFVISNGVDTKYFANTDSKPLYSLTFFWTDIENKRISTLLDFSHSFLEVSHVSKMISRYTVVNDTDKLIMVMRPYQVYASDILVKTALETSSGGYIWHTTGSGKTLTSFKASQILSKEQTIKKVFFVVDRRDLDTQTTSEFNKFEAGSVDATSNTASLVKQIADRDRKLIVTTIQKLSNAARYKKYESYMEPYANEKVIIIFDECHRSMFGDMVKDIKKRFLKAQFFGFTGTPRFEKNKSQDGRTTADIFGKCLHTYLIKEAILDNNVLGFSVEYIQTFKGQYDDNDNTKVYGIDTAEVFDHPERISLVAHHIVEHHHLKTRNKQYTAIYTTSSVANLIRYYDEFASFEHDLKIAAIFSFGVNEESEGRDEHSRDALERIISDYNKMFGTKFSTETFSAYNADVSRRVKTAQIDVLIVVEMYLTGFDSKPLNTLYVDKNLEYHNLLQAYSRTNRVEASTKPFGNIVCYRNLKFKTDEAICLFSQTSNVDDVLMKDYSYYLELFKTKLQDVLRIALTPADVGLLVTEEEKREFIVAFRELSKVLLVLKTFTEFEFDERILEISEQEYEDFKSKYFLLYEESKNEGAYVKCSILNDIDFGIELMATDRINVTYIMTLLRNVDLTDKEKQKKDVEHLKSEMDRSDNLELRRKVDLIKKFLDDVLPGVSHFDSIDDAYDSFENAERNKEISAFAENIGVSSELLRAEIADYEYTGIIRKDNIMSSIDKPFLEKKSIGAKVVEFIMDNVSRFA